jgi:hypothetical protein
MTKQCILSLDLGMDSSLTLILHCSMHVHSQLNDWLAYDSVSENRVHGCVRLFMADVRSVVRRRESGSGQV